MDNCNNLGCTHRAIYNVKRVQACAGFLAQAQVEGLLGNSSGFSGNPWMGNNYLGGLYCMGGLYCPSYGRTSPSRYTDKKKFSFKLSAADDDCVYVAFGEAKGEGRQALAIFETSGSDDCEYLSHITLGDTLDDIPEKIIVRGELAVIGAYNGGTVYLIDISDKEYPELINKLALGRKYGGTGGVTSLAIEDEVLFVSIEFEGSDKHIIYSLDISEPEETDEDDDLLDSYILDDDDYQEIYNMVSVPGYLYISAKYKDDSTILIMDISEPDDLLTEYFSDLLCRINLKDGSFGYIYLLFEHKSYQEHLAAFHILRYMVKIWKLWLKEKVGHRSDNYTDDRLSWGKSMGSKVKLHRIEEVRSCQPLPIHSLRKGKNKGYKREYSRESFKMLVRQKPPILPGAGKKLACTIYCTL